MKSTKIKLAGLVFVFVCFISLTLLLFSSHILNIKEKTIFKNFNKNNYTLEFVSSNNIKNNLFTYDNYIVSGYEINGIYLNYQGYLINLNKALDKNYITIDDILNNLELTMDNDNIKKYSSDNYDVLLITNDKYQEVTFIMK
jgi:hypothetical protein